MKNKIILMLKGAVFGVANVIPGVSGGTIALTMGVYEDFISSISNFFNKPKKSLKFLLPFGIGAALSILLMSKLISFCLDKFPFPTTLFFVGLILGGVPMLTKKVRKKKVKTTNLGLFALTFSIVMIMFFMKSGNNFVNLESPNILMYIILGLVGMIAAATMIIPGVSGSFVLMLLGFYEPIVNTVGDLTNFSNLAHNLLILVPFGLGVVLGMILIAKLIEYLFKKYEIPTYYAILGFVIASIITLIIGAISTKLAVIHILVGLITLVVGTFAGYKLGDE